MGKQQDWKKVSKLRKIVKDMKTTAVKCSRTGNIKGGVILNDETVKPYMEELANLEAKLAKEKEEMSTGERVDTAAAEVIADAEQNKDEIKSYIDEKFAKLAPKKFTQQINKWAYIAAKGSGDYYKTLSGQIFPRKGDIPEECTFMHKVRVHECIDNDLDIYKYFHEDGTAGSEKGIESFQFISQVGMKVSLKECALPPALEKFAGMEGKIENEPVANKAMSDKDIFDISFPTKTKRGNSTTTRKVRREFLNIQSGKDDDNLDSNTKEEVSTACDSTREGDSYTLGIESSASISVSGMEEQTEFSPWQAVPMMETPPQGLASESTAELNLSQGDSPSLLSIEWINSFPEKAKATIQPYAEQVVAIFKKHKKAQKIEREIHTLNRNMEKCIEFHCRMKWEGRCVRLYGPTMAPFCTVNVPLVAQ